MDRPADGTLAMTANSERNSEGPSVTWPKLPSQGQNHSPDSKTIHVDWKLPSEPAFVIFQVFEQTPMAGLIWLSEPELWDWGRDLVPVPGTPWSLELVLDMSPLGGRWDGPTPLDLVGRHMIGNDNDGI